MVTNFDNDLTWGYDDASNNLTIGKWEHVPTAASGSENISLVTKDFDFGDPGRDTFIYKVIAQYIGGTSQDVEAFYRTNGSQAGWTSFSTTKLDDTTGNAITVEMKPSTTIKNKKSFQLKLSGTAARTFMLNDLTIIYREKSIG